MAVSTALLGWGWNQVVPFHSTSETESNETFLFFILKKIFWTVVIERSRSASLFQCRSNMNQFIHFPFCFFFRVHRALMIRKRRTKEKGKWTTSESEDAAFGLPGTDRQSEHFPWLRKKNTAVETNELGVIQFYWRIKKKVDSYPLVDGFIGFFYWLVSTFFKFSNTSYFVEIFIHFVGFISRVPIELRRTIQRLLGIVLILLKMSHDHSRNSVRCSKKAERRLHNGDCEGKKKRTDSKASIEFRLKKENWKEHDWPMVALEADDTLTSMTNQKGENTHTHTHTHTHTTSDGISDAWRHRRATNSGREKLSSSPWSPGQTGETIRQLPASFNKYKWGSLTGNKKK